MKTFSEIGIKPELEAFLKKINFLNPTEVQEVAIPKVLAGKDLIVRSKTGTGKTGAFLIPIINRLQRNDGLKAIIIVPTRELALQVTGVADKLCRNFGMHVVTVYGGASINVQVDQIRRGVNIVVGTPGRILDLIERGALKLNGIKYLVLDEADIMLDMGFIDDVDAIISNMPEDKQTMLFSATIPKEILDIARRHMKQDREKITIGQEEDLTVSSIIHRYAITSPNTKFHTLLAYIDKYDPKKAIIFANTKNAADRIYEMLKSQGLNSILLHGGLTQAKRERSLGIFRADARFLIATNIASRGLDIPSISDIINFDAPDMSTTYVHRVGRSARMGKEGRAFTIITNSQRRLIDEIKYEANINIERITLDTEKFKDVKVSFRNPERNFGNDRFHGGRGGGYHDRQHDHDKGGYHKGGYGGRNRENSHGTHRSGQGSYRH